MNKIRRHWSNLWPSFWFVPSLIVAGSVAIAVALIQLDAAGSQQLMSRWTRLFSASAAPGTSTSLQTQRLLGRRNRLSRRSRGTLHQGICFETEIVSMEIGFDGASNR